MTRTDRTHMSGGVRPRIATLASLALVATLVTPGVTPAVADTPVGEPPLADDLAGPYEVGVVDATLPVGHRERDLPVQVWYPATTAEHDQPFSYAIGVELPPLPPISFALPSPTGYHAPTLVGNDLPVVVFSHGLGGVRFQSFTITEALASHGYVVVAADHLGHTAADLIGLADQIPDGDLDESTLDVIQFEGEPDLDRPLDVTALLDALEAGTLVPDVLGDALDLDRVAVAGHSYGGYTALATAGGNELVGYEADPRVDAIVPIAPLATPRVLSDTALAAIEVPALFLGATEDTLTPIGPNIGRAVSLLGSTRVDRLDFEDAGHFHFADLCAIGDALQEQLGGLADPILDLLPGYTETCDGTLRDVDEVLQLSARAIVGFLDDVLAVDGPADPTDPTVPTDPTGPTDPAPVRFLDLDPGSSHGPAIIELATEGVLRGYPDGTFRPRSPVTRGQLASVLARSLGLEDRAPTGFGDLAGDVHAGAVGALAERGIVRGYDDGTYRPGQHIRRDHAASILARALALPPVADGPFTDVADTTHAGAINALHAAGVIEGRTPDRFDPAGELRRDQTASLLVRARDVAS